MVVGQIALSIHDSQRTPSPVSTTFHWSGFPHWTDKDKKKKGDNLKKEYALSNLKEAREHLDDIIRQLEQSRNLEPLRNGYLIAYFNEVYWHINRVWNCRNISQEKIDRSYNEEFDEL